MRPRSALPIAGFVLLFMAGCRPSKILLTPMPARVDTIEGYAQLRIQGDQGMGRSKFSFAFELPGRGKIEVSDFFVGSLYQIVINREGAFFILPSKKAYWQGAEEEIIDKFLGFPLNLAEIVFLMTGQRDSSEIDRSEENRWRGWTLQEDKTGRIRSGRRGDLKFVIREFVEDTPVAALLEFEHPLNTGRLNILHIGFNRTFRSSTFSTTFLSTFEQKTWAEIEEMLNRED